jgi:hypothetical protein
MRKQFYLDLCNRLDLIRDLADEKIFKHYDLWNQQLNPDFGEEFPMPAVFLEFLPIQWKTLGKFRQQTLLQFNLHVCTATMQRGSSKSPYRDKILGHLDLLDAIHLWLTGWRGAYFNSVTRTASRQDHYYSNVIDHIETYRTLLVDDSAQRTFVVKEDPNALIVNIELLFNAPDAGESPTPDGGGDESLPAEGGGDESLPAEGGESLHSGEEVL